MFGIDWRRAEATEPGLRCGSSVRGSELEHTTTVPRLSAATRVTPRPTSAAADILGAEPHSRSAMTEGETEAEEADGERPLAWHVGLGETEAPGGPAGEAPASPPRRTQELAGALAQRRAMLEGRAQTFESSPEASTADASHLEGLAFGALPLGEWLNSVGDPEEDRIAELAEAGLRKRGPTPAHAPKMDAENSRLLKGLVEEILAMIIITITIITINTIITMTITITIIIIVIMIIVINVMIIIITIKELERLRKQVVREHEEVRDERGGLSRREAELQEHLYNNDNDNDNNNNNNNDNNNDNNNNNSNDNNDNSNNNDNDNVLV